MILLLYFIPPILAMFIRPRCAIFGRVWLFNLVSLFLWPVLIFMIPIQTR